MNKSISKPPVVKVFQTDDGRQYVFWCPFCDYIHRHGAVGLGHRIAHCSNQRSPYLFDGYILKAYTQKELRELGLPTNHYSKHKRR